jgi:hypothetical protein
MAHSPSVHSSSGQDQFHYSPLTAHGQAQDLEAGIPFCLIIRVRLDGSAALAAGAKMRAPSGKTDELDPASATPTGFPFPTINPQAILKQPLEPEAVTEIADRRALESDRFLQDGRNSVLESFQAPAAQT